MSSRAEKAARRRPAIADRLMAKRDVAENGCWHWTGRINDKGYGITGYLSKDQGVHRVSYLVFVGPIPDALVVDHCCHNQDLTCRGGASCLHRRCFNPDHLAIVTKGDNGRTGRTGAHLAERTHCPAGHEYAEFGVRYPSGHNRRECRECKRMRSAAFDARRRAAGFWPNARPEVD